MLGVLCAGAAGAMEAGAAKVEITPELGTPLAGSYQRMGRGATAVHDPFYVRALYLEDGETQVFLVSADLAAISPELREAVLERPLHDVPRENVFLTATHTMSSAPPRTLTRAKLIVWAMVSMSLVMRLITFPASFSA